MKNVSGQIRKWLAAGWMLALPFIVFSPSAFSAAAHSGADTFQTKCALCHGPDGAGNTPMGKRSKIKDLRSADVQKETDDELAAAIADGEPPMPAYRKTLSVADIERVVTYLRRLAAKN